MLLVDFLSVSVAKWEGVDPLAQVCVIHLFWASCNDYLIWFPVENSWKVFNIRSLNSRRRFHIRSPRSSNLVSFREFVRLLFSLFQEEKPVIIVMTERALGLVVLIFYLQGHLLRLMLLMDRNWLLRIIWFIPINVFINCLSIDFTLF